MIHYTAPTPADLQKLKEKLDYSGSEMADLVSVSGGQQWRKYTGGQAVREISIHMLFFMAARLALTEPELRRVVEKMREIGAEINLDHLAK